MNRNQRAQLAQQTLSIIEAGTYTAPSGKTVNISSDVQHCIELTMVYEPSGFASLKEQLPPTEPYNTVVEVSNESTLDAAKRLSDTGDYRHIVCLNFASAKNPGGGFLGGSQAQEESLARSSALYASLNEATQYYEYNRKNKTALYSDYMIFSPNVPVFRNDTAELLEQPYTVSFITAPAVNAGAVDKNEPHNVDKIYPTLVNRAENLLTVAAQQHCDALVLGAWGCGVFKNDPKDIADIWYQLLFNSTNFASRFRYISFAVLERNNSGTYDIFKERLTKFV